MRFRLVESFNDNIFYHATEYVIKNNTLYPNEQGLHLTDTEAGARSVMEDRHIENYNMYQAKVPYKLNCLQMDFDLSYWSASEIASCLLLKLGEDIQPEMTFNNEIIKPEQVHIDNLTEPDKEILYKFYDCNNDYNDFYNIMKFLKTKGFNAIKYPLQESKILEYSIIIDEPVECSLIGNINVNREWQYTDEMIDAYNDFKKDIQYEQ